jgi:hypothetical protein
MRITAVIVLAFASALAAQPPARPLAHTAVSFAKPNAVLGEVCAELGKSANVPIDVPPALLKAKCGATFKSAPFWEALDSAARASDARLVLSDGGRKVALAPRGKSREVSATSGAFRVVAQSVIGRALLEQGTTVHEVQMLVHWEPRLRVYKIDTAPRVSEATDANGVKLEVSNGGGEVPPSDSTSELRVRLSGLTRGSERIKSLSGTFKATAAERMAMLDFDASAKLPAKAEDAGLTALLKRFEKKDDVWEVAIDVTYPPNPPTFQSFQGEWWLRDNRLVLRDPTGKAHVLSDYEVPSPEFRPLSVVYRFKEDKAAGLVNPTAKGWRAVYETPGPLREVQVPFELKDVPIP